MAARADDPRNRWVQGPGHAGHSAPMQGSAQAPQECWGDRSTARRC